MFIKVLKLKVLKLKLNGNEKLLGKLSNLGAILSFTMQAQICSAPLFLTSLRASLLCLVAQNGVYVWQLNANVNYSSF